MLHYHSENQPSPWVCKVGKKYNIWFAYTSFWKALLKLPSLMWGFRNHG